MFSRTLVKTQAKALNLSIKNKFAQDWSHIYDGIYRFEDNSLG